MNGMCSVWRLLASGVLEGSILGPVLLNVSIGDLEEAMEYLLIKSAHYTALGGPADTPWGPQAAI